jgi:hypothetical protein
MAPAPDKSLRETVYEALLSAFNDSRMPVTTDVLIDVVGAPRQKIGEALDFFVDRGSVIRIKPGFFQPAHRYHETRLMSRTLLPGGMVKWELGDICVDLNPEEDRMATYLFGGGSRAHEAEAMQMLRVTQAQLAVQLNQVIRQNKALEAQVRELKDGVPQLKLLDA